MPKKSSINLKFLKINYLNNLIYFDGKNNPKQLFTNKLTNFFKENFETHTIFDYDGMQYCFGALEIGDKYIFGKLWKLKKKQDKDFPWDGKDYKPTPQIEADYHFAYFYINTLSNHLVLQDERDLTSETSVSVLISWFDSFHDLKDGLNLQYLKSKKDFIKELQEAYRIIYAKFTVYPSNIDFDNISEPLDNSMHELEISEMKQEIKSNQGVKLDLENPNIFSSSLAQSMRGNGKDPEVRVKDRNGNISILSKKIKHIRKQVDNLGDVNDTWRIKTILISQLNEVIKELDRQDGLQNN